jgi:hypothetical protein
MEDCFTILLQVADLFAAPAGALATSVSGSIAAAAADATFTMDQFIRISLQ